MRAILIHNPGAGSEEHSKDALLSALRLAGVSASYCSTKQKDFEQVCRRADLIIVAGGDGTVAKVIAGLPDRSIPVGIFPIGTANNIARSLGISGAPIELAEILGRDDTLRLDIGEARGPWGKRKFVEAVGVGPIARSIQKRPRGKLTGVENLRKGREKLQKLLQKCKPLELAVSVDGRELADDILAVEVVNVVYTGPALALAASADPGDGKFDIVCVPVSRRKEMIAWLEAPHEDAAPVVVHQGNKITMSGTFPHQRVDDEVFDPVDGEQTITIALEHEAAKILVPSPKQVALQNRENGKTKAK